jgi:4-hydroxy-2-oxoheptanedioate aldolase
VSTDHRPLPSDRLREMFAEGDTAATAWISGDSTYLTEVLSCAGFDAVTVDLQHGMFGIGTAIRLLQVTSAGGAVPMARCSSLDPAQIGKLLDGGACGIVCPAIDHREDAEAFIAACRYPPQGVRSYGPSRGLLVGGPDYPTVANESILTWAMIESASGLDAIDEILAVPGLDGIYVGPNDLALSLGEQPGPNLGSGVARAVRDLVDTCHRAGRFCGGFAATTETATWMAEIGYDLVAPGNDAGLLRDAASRRLEAVRRGSQARTS